MSAWGWKLGTGLGDVRLGMYVGSHLYKYDHETVRSDLQGVTFQTRKTKDVFQVMPIVLWLLGFFWSCFGLMTGWGLLNIGQGGGKRSVQCHWSRGTVLGKKKKDKAWRKWWENMCYLWFSGGPVTPGIFERKGVGLAITVIGGMLPVWRSRKGGRLSLAALSKMSTAYPGFWSLHSFSSLALIDILRIVSLISLSCLLFLSKL